MIIDLFSIQVFPARRLRAPTAISYGHIDARHKMGWIRSVDQDLLRIMNPLQDPNFGVVSNRDHRVQYSNFRMVPSKERASDVSQKPEVLTGGKGANTNK